MNNFRHLLSCYPLTLVCLGLVWYLSLFVTLPSTPIDDVPFIDKWTHLAMYGGTCSVMWWEYSRCHLCLTGWKLVLYAWLGPIVMSGVIELLQKWCTATRSGEWLDFAANATGATLAVPVGLLLWRLTR